MFAAASAIKASKGCGLEQLLLLVLLLLLLPGRGVGAGAGAGARAGEIHNTGLP